MKRICGRMNCFKCTYPDCINDGPPSLREIAIIESHDKLVQCLYPYDIAAKQKKKKHRNDTEKQKQYRKEHREDYVRRMREWRKRRREGK